MAYHLVTEHPDLLKTQTIRYQCSVTAKVIRIHEPRFPPGPPLTLRPNSLAAFCSSLTMSSKGSGTRRYLIFKHINALFRNIGLYREGKTTRCTPTNITFLQLPELVTFWTGLVYLSQGDVHKVVTIDKMSVECLSILQLNQLQKVQEM